MYLYVHVTHKKVIMMRYISMSRPHFPSMWEMLQHFTHAQCEMSLRDLTHAQCKILSEKDGCSGLPEAAQGLNL